MKAVLASALAALVLAVGTRAVAGEKPATPPAAATAAAGAVAKLDINRASVDELVGVPGIGPRMAQAIIELRTKKGSFTTFDELLQVRGIKERTLKAIAPYFAVLTPPAATTQSR
jgi:competence protein ComEA